MSINEAPFEIIAGPGQVWLAPVGEAFPAINAAPAGNWVDLGETDGGIEIAFPQEIKELETDQAFFPKKPIRVKQRCTVKFSLAELTLENFARVLNGVTVTDTPAGAGTPGHRSIPLQGSSSVKQYALLIRGPSPYGDWYLQFELDRVYQQGEPTTRFVKDDKSVLATEWNCLEGSTTNQVGVLRAQDAAPL